MKKIYIIILLIFASKSFSQIFNVEIVTKQHDTLRNVNLKVNYLSKVELNYKLQEKLVVLDKDGNKKTYLPTDVISFRLKFEGTDLFYESIEGKLFAQPMYANKLKLYKFIKQAYTSVNYYIVVRPNGKVSYMEAMGLSRLISKKVISRELADCKSTIDKVENKELRIQGELGVIELIKDYEQSCF